MTIRMQTGAVQPTWCQTLGSSRAPLAGTEPLICAMHCKVPAIPAQLGGPVGLEQLPAPHSDKAQLIDMMQQVGLGKAWCYAKQSCFQLHHLG